MKRSEFDRRRRQNLKLGLVLGLLAVIVLVTILAPWISPYDPVQIDMKNRLAPPSTAHWLGTDALGRDVFSRVLHGGRASLLLAVLATSFSMALGLIIGVAAGYCGGVVDTVITAVANIFQGLPGTMMMIALVGILGSNTRSIILEWPALSATTLRLSLRSLPFAP